MVVGELKKSGAGERVEAHVPVIDVKMLSGTIGK